MANYMSDVERDQEYRRAISFVQEARKLNNQVKRIRRVSELNGQGFGTYGSILDGLLADAASLDAEAQAILAAIDDNAQPILYCPPSFVTWVSSTDRIGFSGNIDVDDLPSTGVITVSGSEVGNDGNYTVTGVNTAYLQLSNDIADTEVETGSLVIKWIQY